MMLGNLAQGRSSGDSAASSESQKKDESYFAAPPAISLPKGGGAIKGMGEKFAANPVTGTGSMSVPISVSPGRSGFGPQLSVSYDSGAGNGIFGLGWNLSLPSITRKTDKGLPRYWDAEESDVFLLSGAEDLVPVGNAVDSPDGQFKIRRYRPRIEGLFARIERWTKLNSGEIHWRSISKDNITTLYGKTENSRIADPEDKIHIFSWLICESYDDKGNAIVYGYKSENPGNTEGIDISQAHEQNRNPKNRAANRYLKRIQYGNRTPRQSGEDLSLRNDWMFEVVFDYGEHDADNPKPNDAGIWQRRNDPFSSYQSGFEVRTYRLCQRVLMFHHFPNELGVGRDCLVRSTDFAYSYEQQSDVVRDPVYSCLRSVTQTGYKRDGEGYFKKSLPPLEFTYSEATIDETVRDVDHTSLENLPDGLDGTRYQWVDLDGEGLSGILTEQGNGWFYKRNLSPINTVQDNVKRHIEANFAPVELVASKPASGLGNGAQFLDLAGDGQPDLVTLRGTAPGFYERTPDESWESFVPFKSLPVLDWENPNLKFIDLNGDGHSDILISEDNCFVWHPSLAEDGFAAAERVTQPWDEEKGPRVVFTDSTQSIHLADMSGDGLTDIVRIRNGEVCYWPNLGYGRFGAKVTMDDAPWFDTTELFNQRRIVLADIDGSGTTDILYLCAEGVQVYFNQSGNGWSAKRVLRSFPAIDSVASVTAIDLLGNGTACLVWSSPLSGNGRRVMRYIDLMGGQKPHLLVKTVNNMGAETVVEYAPSTKFYLQDKLAGTPWVTKLPFPVHVVERVETYDRISRNRFVTRYAYHHGYFDGVEREFRGFGRVDQWDTKEIGTIQPGETTSDATNLDAVSFVPPVMTKTWFHTGAYLNRDKISIHFEHEYFREPNESEPAFQASLLPDTILPNGLTAEEEREAARSLKGHILRQEIYALDGSPKQPYPYSVSERNYEIRVEQPLGTNRHAVFFAHDRETIDYHYERNPADPRVTHAMTLEVDEFGNGLKSVAIAYPRRKPSSLPDTRLEQQKQTHITYSENQVTNKPNEASWYRIGVPIETRAYEITGINVADSSFFVPFTLDFIRDRIAAIPAADVIPYEAIATPNKIQKRLIERVRTLYRPDNQANTTSPVCLILGEIESLALPCESYKMAFTTGLLEQIYGASNGNKIATNDLNNLLRNEGRYQDFDGAWWIPSGHQKFDPDHFYLVTATKDPFDHEYTVTYDNYQLLAVQTSDPVNNTVQIKNDYRVLQPQRIIDPNQNHAVVAFDILGMVAGTAVLGKVDAAGNSESGDSLDGFVADLSQQQLENFVRSPRTTASTLLGKATTRIIYDLECFRDSQQPLFAAAIARETHVSDLAAGQQTKVQVSFVYSDGFGREVQTKVQAEPGNAPQREANAANPDRPGKLVLENGKPKFMPTDPRWVGNGRTIFNNKGKPVKKYEPFFSSTHLYEDEPEMVMTGVTPILFYDPVERVVATLHPNHTYEKVVFDPWQQATWDGNDTVVQTAVGAIANDPKTDPDVGQYFKRLPDSDYLPTWYSQMSGSAIASEQNAAQKALAHVGTAAIAHLDTLGRTFLTIADNGAAGQYETRVEQDIEGNPLVVTDARQNAVMIYAVVQKDGQGKPVKDGQGKPILRGRAYDLLGHNLYSYSMDAGDRWMINNVAGKPMRMWDSRGLTRRFTYDALQRPLELFVRDVQGERLAEQTTYGEAIGEASNHRGKVHQVLDGAGIVTSVAYDFKGNLLRSQRQLLRDYDKAVNWLDNPVPTETFISQSQFDALNRPIAMTMPDNSVVMPVFNEANLLNQVKIRLRSALAETLFVKNIDYNAKGQRTLIEYSVGDPNNPANGVQTAYVYEPETFRLKNLRTTRKTDNQRLQDLSYTYDPVGNITTIRDDAQQTIFFQNDLVSPSSQYAYDALYRLISAEGREHVGQNANAQPDHSEIPRMDLPHANNAQAMRRYREAYEYDPVGNIQRMIHRAMTNDQPNEPPVWTRRYRYSLDNNRLLATSLPGDADGIFSAPYAYDAHGNMSQMPHLPLMRWDFKDQLQASSQQVRNDGGTPEITYYVYDASGERVRKVTERQADAGQTPKRKSERIYLGGFEIYREYNGDGTTVALERETLHVMDDKQRIALVETKTRDAGNPVANPKPITRYQLSNHLGSASLELDQDGNLLSYEEYHPYGTTSYQARRSVAEVSLKRYRYTGKERDEETGLAYHGARYYALWLGRWVSCDPIRIADGLNLYRYTSNNPIIHSDLTGTQQKAVCSIAPDHPSAVVCTPVPEANTEPSTEEVTVRGPKRGSKERQAELDAMRRKSESIPPSSSPQSPQPSPDWTTQTEWVFPTTKHSPISMVTNYDTGNSALNFTLNKLVLPWRNLLAAIENTPFEMMGELDDVMRSSPFRMEWQAFQDMAPMAKTMGLALEAPGAINYLRAVASTRHRQFALSFLSLTGVMGASGTEGSAAARTFQVSGKAEFYGAGAVNAAEVESTLSGKGVYQLVGDHPPGDLGQSVVRVGEGDILKRFAAHSHGADQRLWRGFQVIANDEGVSQRLILEADIGLSQDLMLSGEASSLYKLPGNPTLGDFAGANFKMPKFTLLNPALYPSARKLTP